MLATFFKRSKHEMNITIPETCSNGSGDKQQMFLQQNSARGKKTALQKIFLGLALNLRKALHSARL